VSATRIGATPSLAGTARDQLYVQTCGKGIVDEFQVNANGSLTEVGSVIVTGAVGGEGIVAF
jgi:hydrogenase maturation factor